MAEEAESQALNAHGEMLVTLDGAQYVLRPSRRAITAIEQRLGKGLMALAQDAARGELTTTDVATIVVEMMRAYVSMNPDCEHADTYRTIKPERATDLIIEAGFGAVLGRITILLAGALMGGYTAEGELKPTR